MVKYPITFKAAVLEEIGKPLVVKDVTFKGPLQAGQVLVKILYSGICGKQIEEIQGDKGEDPFLPHMLGHEGSGVVVDVGPGVKKVFPGDTVVLHWMKGTGIDAPTPRYFSGEKRINAGWVTTFNEYGVISENRITKISEDFDLSIACLLGCAVTTGLGVVINEGNVRPGQSVVVFGCGGVGLNVVQGARIVNAHPIIAVDRNDEKLKLAKELGATHTINVQSAHDVIDEIKKVTGGKGADFVMISLNNANAIETAVNCSSLPGSVFFIGVPKKGSEIRITPFEVHCLRTLRGSFGGGIFPDRDIPGYLSMYVRGVLKLDELVTEQFSLSDINDGVNRLLSGKSVRCVVKMHD